MRIRLYSIRDRLLGVYLAPFSARADVDALRQIKASLSDERMATSGLATNPSDFDLCYMATLDDETGQVFPEQHAAGSAPCIVANIAALSGHPALTSQPAQTVQS